VQPQVAHHLGAVADEPQPGSGGLPDAGLPRAGADARQPAAPGLWFIGYRTEVVGNLRLHPIEARRIARAISRG